LVGSESRNYQREVGNWEDGGCDGGVVVGSKIEGWTSWLKEANVFKNQARERQSFRQLPIEK
jgi:hypothetical protein